MQVVRKVCACVVREGVEGPEVLVFDHPMAGTQLPKGTLEPSEEPLDGVLRELGEETGLRSVDLVRHLGQWTRWTGAGPDENGDPERHDWEVFLLRPVCELPMSWSHIAFGSAAEIGKEFRCRWLRLDWRRRRQAPSTLLGDNRMVQDAVGALPDWTGFS